MKKIFVPIVSFMLSIGAGLMPAQAADHVVEIDLSSSSVNVVDDSGQTLTQKSQVTNDTVLDQPNYDIEIGKHAPGSLQLLIQIDSEQAPSDYQFAIPDALYMEEILLGDSKIYRLVGQQDTTVGWIGNPWAHDANGVKLPTRFVFKSGVLTQHVDLSSPNIAYPVTADPYLGVNLISSVKSTWTSNSYYVLSIAVSNWMWDVYGIYSTFGVWGYTQAYNVAITYGWDEVLSKFATKNGMWFRDYIVSKPSFEDQWDCHSLGAPALFAGVIFGTDPHPTWDLEGFRPHVTSMATWISSACGWK